MNKLAKQAMMGVAFTLIACSFARAESITMSRDLAWMHAQFSDDSNAGRKTSTLVLAVPETDSTALYATCHSGSDTATIEVSTDVSGMRDGQAASVTFYNHSTEFKLPGKVVGTLAEQGVSGVAITIDNQHPLWEVLPLWYPVSYRNGTDDYTILSRDSSNAIDSFIDDCRTYGRGKKARMGSVARTGQPAASWGGRVRSGPGKNFSQVGSLREGDPILLLERTGAMLDGFPWFRIGYGNGGTGFHWGGIICGVDGPIDGTYKVCGAASQAIRPASGKRTSCASENGIRSTDDAEPATIRFSAVGENDETQFKIYWLDYDGNRQLYKHIFAGEDNVQRTFVSHPWLVTAPIPGGGEQCVGIYWPSADSTTIVLR